MTRFIIEIQDNTDDPDIWPGDIKVLAMLEDGTVVGATTGPLGNPNMMSYVGLQMERHHRAQRGGPPVQTSGIMSEDDIEEEMRRIIPI